MLWRPMGGSGKFYHDTTSTHLPNPVINDGWTLKDYTFFPSCFSQGKKLKLEQETVDDEEGDVTDEDEAADIDQEAAAVAIAKENAGAEAGSSAGAEGPSSTPVTPPVKKKEKKSKKARYYVFLLL